MDGLDFFSPTEGGESYDPAAFERFKEQVKKNAQFVAALQKDEKKKKKKEDALAQILLQFIQANQNSELMVIVAELLEQNIPASFILALIVLGNDDIKQAILAHEEREAQLALAAGEFPEPKEGGPEKRDPLSGREMVTSEFSLVSRFTSATISLEIKIALDEWGIGIYQAGTSQPFRILETVLDKEGHVKEIVSKATATVMQHFLVEKDPNTFRARGFSTFFSFSEFMLKSVLQKLKEQIENQKQLN